MIIVFANLITPQGQNSHWGIVVVITFFFSYTFARWGNSRRYPFEVLCGSGKCGLREGGERRETRDSGIWPVIPGAVDNPPWSSSLPYIYLYPFVFFLLPFFVALSLSLFFHMSLPLSLSPYSSILHHHLISTFLLPASTSLYSSIFNPPPLSYRLFPLHSSSQTVALVLSFLHTTDLKHLPGPPHITFLPSA